MGLLNTESYNDTTQHETSSSSSISILSKKVSRALEVRTDTPAMITALSALDSLAASSTAAANKASSAVAVSSSGVADNNSGIIDARSVRAAIEQDALQQALLLQDELRNLTDSIKYLKGCISDVTKSAKRVSEVIESDVVLLGATSKALDDDGIIIDTNTGEHQENVAYSTQEKTSFEEEKNLALLLSNTFRARDEARVRSNTIRIFLEKFDLTEEDNYLLEHYSFHDFEGEGNVDGAGAGGGSGMAFLSAIESVRRIRIELAKTFGSSASAAASGDYMDSSEGQTRLGASSALRMMETLASKQERAYDRLYRWLQGYLNLGMAAVAHVPTSSVMARKGVHTRYGGPAANTNPHLLDADAMDEALAHPFVKRALLVLKHVPSFHSHTLELISTQRRAEVTRRFLLALTSGPTPMEMKAHDPVNYVGDMLAFVFRSLSTESYLAHGLLDDNNESTEAYSSEGVLDETDSLTFTSKPMTSMQMLSIAMSGVTRPLKARISQVISSLARRPDDEDDDDNDNTSFPSSNEEAANSESRISSLYSIAGLLLFYHSAVTKSISKLNQSSTTSQEDESEYESNKYKLNLLNSLRDCLKEASSAYAASLKVYAAMLQSYASNIHDSSEATLANSIIVLISDTRLASPGFSSDASALIEPTSQANLSIETLCNTILSVATPLCSSLEDISLLKSTIASCKKSGLNPNVIKTWSNEISKKENKLMEDLIGIQTMQVLYKVGIGEMYESIMNVEKIVREDTILSLQPGLHPKLVQPALKTFYDSLYSPPIPTFDFLKDPMLKKNCRKMTATNVAEAYEKIFDMMSSDRGGYDDLSFLIHKPDQVKTLLSGF